MPARLQRAIETVQQIPAVLKILDVICRTTGMGFAVVARITDDKWVACEVLDTIDFGVKAGTERPVETSLCSEVAGTHSPIVLNHASQDLRYGHHRARHAFGFESYISMPIILANGSVFGTLCAMDPRPARLDQPETVDMFRLFAELIAVHIDARSTLSTSRSALASESAKLRVSEASLAGETARLRVSEANLADESERLRLSQATLLDERQASELREQFIAVLGHDLRNPLASIGGGLELLARQPLNDKGRGVLRLMTAAAQRMSGLIDNVLDFARGRLGGGLGLERTTQPMGPELTHVIDELRVAYPERRIEIDFTLNAPVTCDTRRIAQLFSNLLGNALTHGGEDKSIRVAAASRDGVFTLSVANSGPPIPAAALPHLFQPFYRGKVRSSLQGLGLGLFISSEIARAHGGRLEVASSAAETSFTLTIPATEEFGGTDVSAPA